MSSNDWQVIQIAAHVSWKLSSVILSPSEYMKSSDQFSVDESHESGTDSGIYDANCAMCHGAEGKGNFMFGAPNLTDDIWLYGGSQKKIIESVNLGRTGNMPGHKEFLGEAKVHLLAAYIASLTE